VVGARLTARATRAHPTSSWHWSRIGMGLLCAQKVLATSRILRMVYARPGARTRLRSTRRPLPAYSRRLVSLQAACSLLHAYGMHASRRQQQACVWNAASGGMCVRYHGDHCDPSEVAAPNGVRLQPVGIIWVYPASPLTTGRRDVRGRPRWHCRVTLRAARHVCATDVQCAQQDWAWACPATRAASCSAADGRRTASARSVSIGSIMCAPSCAIDHHRSKPSL